MSFDIIRSQYEAAQVEAGRAQERLSGITQGVVDILSKHGRNRGIFGFLGVERYVKVDHWHGDSQKEGRSRAVVEISTVTRSGFDRYELGESLIDVSVEWLGEINKYTLKPKSVDSYKLGGDQGWEDCLELEQVIEWLESNLV